MEKNVVLFGAGNAGRFLCDEILQKKSDINIIAFIDNFSKESYCGIKCYKPQDFFERNVMNIDSAFIAAGAQKSIKNLMDTALVYGIEEIYMLHDIAGKCKISPFNSDGEIIPQYLRRIRFSKEKPTLPYFEVPITDRCNLNCKGCLFACNGISNSEDVDFEQLEKDATRIRELFYDIPWIRILGGEPLMHPHILDILSLYREIFPDSEIDLCTNGLLLPKMNRMFYEHLVRLKVTVHVSGYKPTYHILDKIEEKLRDNGLHYTVLKRDKFSKYYSLRKNNSKDSSFADCIASGCRELYKGRLMRCSAVIAFEKFNEMFGTKFLTEKREDWFDIHENGINGWDIMKQLDKASQICSYCNVKEMEEFEWDYAGNEVSLKDYILKD